MYLLFGKNGWLKTWAYKWNKNIESNIQGVMSTIRKTVRYSTSRFTPTYFRGGYTGHTVNINPPLRDVVSVNFTGLHSKNRYIMTNKTRSTRYGASFYIKLYSGSRVVKTLVFSAGRGMNRARNLSYLMRRRYSLSNLTVTKVVFSGDRYRGRDFSYTLDNRSTFLFEQRPKVSINVSSEAFASYVNLDWRNPSIPRTQYRVLYGRIIVSPTSYNMDATVSSLLPGKRYGYQIQYYDSAWATSKTIYVTTKKSRLYLVEKGTTYMKIRWDPIYADASYMLRIIDMDSGNDEEINTQGLEHTIRDMGPGQGYRFQLHAIENGKPVVINV